MNPHFQALEGQIKRRKRALNGLAGASDWVSISLSVSLIYLGAVTLGLLSSLWPAWALGLINLIIGLAGWLRGWLRPIDLAATLFQVDRALGTGEALCTYHEFSGRRARPPFSWRLEQAISSIAVDPAAALPLTGRQRRRLATIAGLALASLWLSGLSPLQVIPTDLAGWSRHNTQNAQTPIQPSAPQPLGPRELQQISAQASELENQLRIEAAPVQARAAAEALNALYQRLREAQQELWKLPRTPADLSTTPADESLEHSQMTPPTDQPDQDEARRLADARQAAQAMQQALDQLKQILNKLQEEGQTGTMDPDAIQKILQQLAQQAPSEAIRQSLAEAAQAETPQGQQQLIAKAQQQLQDLLKQDQQLERAQQQIAQALREGAERPSPQGPLSQTNGEVDRESNPADSSSSKGDATTNSQHRGGGKRGSADGQEKEEAKRQEGQQGTDTAEGQTLNQSGGDQPGRGEAPFTPELSANQSLPAEHQIVISRDRLPPDVQLQLVMLSKGVPFEAVGSSKSGDLTLRYDFAKAESLLKLRGLPLALRDLIRQYFVAITAERGQP